MPRALKLFLAGFGLLVALAAAAQVAQTLTPIPPPRDCRSFICAPDTRAPDAPPRTAAEILGRACPSPGVYPGSRPGCIYPGSIPGLPQVWSITGL